MRRSFGPNKLYSKVFFEHLRKLFQRGYSIEFFPEGGRTRTGRLLTPRPGIISMIIKSFQDMDERDVKFLPISISYEKVLEGKSHLKESRGQKKKKESLTSIFSTIGDFRGYLGNAYLQFGEPIDLKSFLNENSPNWQEDVIDLNTDTEKKSWLFEVTPLLGNKIMTNINKATVVTSSSLFASAISDIVGDEIDKERLINRIEGLKKVIEISKYSNLIKLPDISSKEILQKIRKLKFYKSEGEKTLKMSKSEKNLMEFYKNNILHLLILQSYIFYKSRKKIMKINLVNQFKEIVPQIKKDFFLDISLSETEEKVSEILTALNNLHLLKINQNDEVSWIESEKEKDIAEMFSSIWVESLSAS